MNKEKAQEILEAYESGGSFNSALYKAVIHADMDNLERLRLAYPALVDAYCVYAGIMLEGVPV